MPLSVVPLASASVLDIVGVAAAADQEGQSSGSRCRPTYSQRPSLAESCRVASAAVSQGTHESPSRLSIWTAGLPSPSRPASGMLAPALGHRHHLGGSSTRPQREARRFPSSRSSAGDARMTHCLEHLREYLEERRLPRSVRADQAQRIKLRVINVGWAYPDVHPIQQTLRTSGPQLHGLAEASWLCPPPEAHRLRLLVEHLDQRRTSDSYKQRKEDVLESVVVTRHLSLRSSSNAKDSWGKASMTSSTLASSIFLHSRPSFELAFGIASSLVLQGSCLADGREQALGRLVVPAFLWRRVPLRWGPIHRGKRARRPGAAARPAVSPREHELRSRRPMRTRLPRGRRFLIVPVGEAQAHQACEPPRCLVPAEHFPPSLTG